MMKKIILIILITALATVFIVWLDKKLSEHNKVKEELRTAAISLSVIILSLIGIFIIVGIGLITLIFCQIDRFIYW